MANNNAKTGQSINTNGQTDTGPAEPAGTTEPAENVLTIPTGETATITDAGNGNADNTISVTPKRRGRPKGTSGGRTNNAQTQKQETETNKGVQFSLGNIVSKIAGGSTSKGSGLNKSTAQAGVNMALRVADGMVRVVAGPLADAVALSKDEYDLIAEPLTNLAVTNGAVGKVIMNMPLLALVIGAGSWGARVASVFRLQAAQQAAIRSGMPTFAPAPPAPPAPPASTTPTFTPSTLTDIANQYQNLGGVNVTPGNTPAPSFIPTPPMQVPSLSPNQSNNPFTPGQFPTVEQMMNRG